jgi:hypothetical protein
MPFPKQFILVVRKFEFGKNSSAKISHFLEKKYNAFLF